MVFEIPIPKAGIQVSNAQTWAKPLHWLGVQQARSTLREFPVSPPFAGEEQSSHYLTAGSMEVGMVKNSSTGAAFQAFSVCETRQMAICESMWLDSCQASVDYFLPLNNYSWLLRKIYRTWPPWH